jgi:hypothetical protein
MRRNEKWADRLLECRLKPLGLELADSGPCRQSLPVQSKGIQEVSIKGLVCKQGIWLQTNRQLMSNPT